jgi:large subunit ribosomal protein L21
LSASWNVRAKSLASKRLKTALQSASDRGRLLGSLLRLAMYAIIETGSKQYRVEKNTVLCIEKLPKEKGGSVTFDRVLAAVDGDQVTVGVPLLKGAKVTAEVVDQFKGEKVITFKKRRRHGYQRTRGHRQNFTKVRITDIQLA